MPKNLDVKTYYKHSLLTNSSYLVQIAIEKYLSSLLFGGDLTKILYASFAYCFRARVNQLQVLGIQPDSYLGTPFAVYYRDTNWKPVKGGGSYSLIKGIEDESIGKTIRAMLVESSYSVFVFYNRDDDAQVAYDTLISDTQPSRLQFFFDSLMYKGREISLPIAFDIQNVSFQMSLKETDWLKQARIIPISFTLQCESAILLNPLYVYTDQDPEDAEEVYISKKVILDYLSYKTNDLFDTSHIDLELLYSLSDPPPIVAVFDKENLTSNSVTLKWAINKNSLPLLKDKVTIVINNYFQYETDLYLTSDDNTIYGNYALTGLYPDSLYNCVLWIKTKNNSVVKKTQSFTTPSVSNALFMKGIEGRT